MAEPETRPDPSLDKRPPKSSGKWKLHIIFLLVGLVTGAAVVALTSSQAAHGTIVAVHQSKYADVDQASAALKAALEAEGFGCKGILNLNKSMAAHGVRHDRQVRVVQFGRAKYAHAMLTESPEVCVLLPCAFGVYEGADHRIYISSINRPLLGKMFGGTVAKVMDEQVAPDQAKVLSTNVQH